MTELRVGVVGYCPPSKFDADEALRLIREAFDTVAANHPGRPITIVSGLTDVGVLGIAYREAVERGWRTVGIASERALEHPLFPVDEHIVVGQNWGDESPFFVDSLHMMIRIGGGKQSHAEAAQMTELGRDVLAYELDLLTD